MITDLPAFSLRSTLLVCSSTDSLAETPRNRTDIWFPFPKTVSVLPSTPPSINRPNLVPANSTIVDQCFDPENPNINSIFSELLPRKEIAPIFDTSLDTDKLLLPGSIKTPVLLKLRTIFAVAGVRYNLTPKITDVSISMRTPAIVQDIKAKLTSETEAFNLQGYSVLLFKISTLGSGFFIFTGQTSSLTHNYPASRTLVADAGVLRLNPRRQNIILSHFDTDFSEEIGLIPFWGFYADNTSNTPQIVASPSKFGNGAVTLELNNQAHLYTYIPWDALQEYTPNFLMQIFVYPDSLYDTTTVFALGDQVGPYGYIVYYYYGELRLLRAPAGSDSGYEEVFKGLIGDYIEQQWMHITLEQTDNGLRLYCDGQLLVNDLDNDNDVYVPVQRLDLRNAIFVGGYANYPGGPQWSSTRGYVDEFRLSIGPSLSGASFTPPTEPYPTVDPAQGDVLLSKVIKTLYAEGTFTLSGQGANLKTVLPVDLELGSYTITGQNATFARAFKTVPAGTGDFILSGKAIVEVSEVNYNVFSGTSYYNVPWPSGTEAGDFAVLLIETSASSSGYTPMMPPFGWTFVAGSPIKHNTDLSAPSYLNVYKRFVADPSAVAVEIGLSSNHFAGVIHTYRNVDTDAPIIESASTENPVGFPVTFPALTEALPRTKVLYLAVGGTDSATGPLLSGAANASTAWGNFGERGRLATTTADGGFAMLYSASIARPIASLPVTTATSNKSTHLLMTLALRPKGWAPYVLSVLPAESGIFTLSGRAAALVKDSNIAPDFGTYNLTGQVAAFVYGKIVTGAAGSVVLMWQDAGFVYSRRVAGATGSFVLTGRTAGLIGSGLKGDTGAFTLSGQAATLKRVLIAGAGSVALSGQAANLLDPNATAYVAAVETADAQDLEFEVVTAIDTFIKGCKADGIWNAIKASCIMAGARTLAGALTPLVGTAPTNNNFVAGDYNRTTGLVGDGSTKYLNSNRANNADPKDSRHMAAYASQGMGNTSVEVMIGSDSTVVNGVSLIFNNADDALYFHSVDNGASSPYALPGFGDVEGFIGHSRSSSTGFTGRFGGSNTSFTSTSETPDSSNISIFARTPSSPARFATCRLAFYSIGESLDLALLDSRVTRLVNEIAFYLNTGLSGINYDIDTLKYINAGYAAGGTLS